MHEVTVVQTKFFVDKFYFEFFQPKGAENGPKMKFFKSYDKSMHGTFRIFLQN